MNWNDPVQRAALIERIGIPAYNKAAAEHQRASVIETVNGYNIAPTQTRFGRLFMVVDTQQAFATIDAAQTYAAIAACRPQ